MTSAPSVPVSSNHCNAPTISIPARVRSAARRSFAFIWRHSYIAAEAESQRLLEFGESDPQLPAESEIGRPAARLNAVGRHREVERDVARIAGRDANRLPALVIGAGELTVKRQGNHQAFDRNLELGAVHDAEHGRGVLELGVLPAEGAAHVLQLGLSEGLRC